MTDEAGFRTITMADVEAVLTLSPLPGKGRSARRLTRRLKRIRKQLRATGGIISVGLDGVLVSGCTLRGVPLPKVDEGPCDLRITNCHASERGPTR